MLTATTRLEIILSSLNLPDDEAKQRAKEIRDVKETLNSGYLYLSLYQLQPSWVELMTQSYLNAKAGIEKRGLGAFETEWRRLGLELDARDKLLASHEKGRSSTAVLALIESSRIQVRPFYQSGRLYGLNTTIGQGLYYLGLAPANLDFALFCQELHLTQAQPQMKMRSLERELSQLEMETLQSYKQPEAINRQPQYNQLNSTLKMASELNREAMYAGALHKYLEANLYLGLIDTRSTDIQELTRLKAESEAFRRRLVDGDVDHSLGLLYWEMAQRALNQRGTENSNGEDLKLAAVILKKVLPAYFKYVMESKQ